MAPDTTASGGPRTAGFFVRARSAMFSSRKAPARTTTQARQVRDRKYGGSTKAMAAAYGVAPRTVLRWIDGSRHPKGDHASKLKGEATDVQTTERGRERRAKQFEGRGRYSGVSVTVSRATTFTIRGSDAVRQRDVDVELTGEQAAALARSDSDDDARRIIGGAVADYFNGGSMYGGFRAEDFDFDPGDFNLR
ncbi:hypothetical protein [Streptomyces sp. N35]|uniref:hypothetical protein n=1 Tax=Streptomyces sp. N35 TaxID=2795730 RepID=UPI0018F66044|nr:hypothetical protein [Streptomyces sp. N35]